MFATSPNADMSRDYALSPAFFDGLASAHFQHLVIALERSYRYPNTSLILKQAEDFYKPRLSKDGINLTTVSFAPGIYPVGSYRKPQAVGLEPPRIFAGQLGLALASSQPYVWIYSEGDLWRRKAAQPFVSAIRNAVRRCGQ